MVIVSSCLYGTGTHCVRIIPDATVSVIQYDSNNVMSKLDVVATSPTTPSYKQRLSVPSVAKHGANTKLKTLMDTSRYKSLELDKS